MALHRFLQSSTLLRCPFQLALKKSLPSSAIAVSTSSAVAAAAQKQPLLPGEGFWDKNSRLGRPTSPHLTIYKFQITTVMSITHRATGFALSGLISGFAIGSLFLSTPFPQLVEAMSQAHYGSLCLFSAKFLVAYPFMYHFTNGIRHLVWDAGHGFEIDTLYKTGYAVLGLSAVLAVVAALM